MRNALVKIDVAAVKLGKDVHRLEQLADNGRLLWVFNLASNSRGRIRSLRFWLPELDAHHAGCHDQLYKFSLSHVIQEILPVSRERYHGSELDNLFQIRPPTRKQLGLELKGRRQGIGTVYERAALGEFLERRWLGAPKTATGGESSKSAVETHPGRSN